MPNHFKVHELLTREELTSLEEFAREPARTVDDCWDWMRAKGYTLARSSVARWKREFDLTDRFRAGSEAARSLIESAKAGGAVAINDAAMLQLSQMIFEQMIRLQNDEEVSTKELWALSMAAKNAVSGKRHVEKLKGEVAEALKQAEAEGGKGASGPELVAKVREILGISA